MTRRIVAALVAVIAVVLIALLASSGTETTTRAGTEAASVAACARTHAANAFAQLPRGMHAVPLDDLIVGAVEDQLSIPPEMRRALQMREIDAGRRRIGAMAVIPAGRRRASLMNAFVDRAMQAGGAPPQQVGGTTLVHLDTAYGKISAAMTFSGCRALLVATRDDATTMLTLRAERAAGSGGA